jgi:hypothetical protein
LGFPPDTQFQFFEENDNFLMKLDAAKAPGRSGFAAKRAILQLPLTAHEWSVTRRSLLPLLRRQPH